MASFIYLGPTHTFGQATPITLKLPLSNGSFQIIRNVVPNVTVLTITDAKAQAHVLARVDMHGHPLFAQQ
jgi:hypothetical protein